MGQKPRELQPYRSAADFFGAELRRLRVAQGLSLQRLSTLVHYDASLLAKIERAERAASGDLAAACDAALSAEGGLVHLWQFVQQDRASPTVGHVDTFGTGIAGTAPTVLTGETIPLSAVINGKVVQLHVDRRTLLQAMLSAGVGGVLPPPARSATVRGPVDPGVIDHFARLRAVLVEADNLLGPQHLLGTVAQQLTIMDDLRRSTRGQLHRDLLATQSRWAEFAGWLTDDMGDVVTGGVWADRAMEMAQEANDPTWIAYVLARKAQRACHTAQADRMVGLAQAAQRAPDLPPLVRAFAYLQQAQGHALAGEARDCEVAIDAAQDLIAAHTGADGTDLGSFCTMSYLRQHEADCWLIQNRPDRAIAAFHVALEHWPADMERDRGLCLARLAHAHLAGKAPDPEQAATVASHAHQISVGTGSARIHADLQRLAAALTPWRRHEPVEQFLSLVDH